MGIRLENVNKYFNKRKSNEIHVINNTSLDLPDSGIVSLLGPSGCGKTTLLNVIGGLDKANSGKIIIDGQNISRKLTGSVDKIRNAKIGYIFQNYNLLDDRTVYDNVAIALRMVGIRDRKTIQARVKYCLEAVGIYQFRNKRADTLSGGQRQRVAIARAIVKNPRIIIADEPTGNLDSVNTLEVMNIIKTISKERLVLLVTHERRIAEFYADRIIELKDGVIQKDYQNDGNRYLDYQLENKIYLKDIPIAREFQSGDTKLEFYSDKEREDDIKIVIRGGNLYINTGGRLNVIDENTNIEMIDDHYRVMDSSIYEKNEFRYDEHLPAKFKARYKSLYTPWNLLFNGFKSISKFKFLKKLLLVGFVFAAMFAFLASSNLFGIFNIEEKDFLTTNDHYITVSNPSHEEKLLDEVARMDGVRYVIPGDSLIQLPMPMDDYYQTSQAMSALTGSLAFASVLGEEDLYIGSLPKGKRDLVIDKMIIDKFLKVHAGQQVGLTTVEQFVGRTIRIPNLDDFTICGISDTNSPSVFAQDDQYLHILSNAPQGSASSEYFEDDYEYYGEDADFTEDENPVVDYKLAPEAAEIKLGEEPRESYEVIVNYSHYVEENGEEGEEEEEEGYDTGGNSGDNEDKMFVLGKELDKKVNGHKLKLVGFYTSDRQDDIYYVNSETLRLQYISKQKSMSVYADDTEQVLSDLKDQGLSAKINYKRDRSNYLKRQESSIRSSLVVAGLILLISLVEMYLMLRSSFLSRIKEVGIMRAIGLKKRDIYRMFTGEILAITLITSIPGIAAMYYIMYHLVKITDFLEGLYLVEPYVAGVAFVLVIVFNLLVGLIPVFRTMRKTPAAILARTDI